MNLEQANWPDHTQISDYMLHKEGPSQDFIKMDFGNSITLCFFSKFVSRTNNSKIYQPNEFPRKQKM